MEEGGCAPSPLDHVWQPLLPIDVLIAIHWLFLDDEGARLECRLVRDLVIQATNHH